MIGAIESIFLFNKAFIAEQLVTDDANTLRNACGMIGAGILVVGKKCSALRTEIRIDVHFTAAILALILCCRRGKRSDKKDVAIRAEHRFVSIFSLTVRTKFHRLY